MLVFFLNYSLRHFRFRIYWGINIKERIYHDTFLCCILYICITCTVHRTVINIEHLAIASAGFFVLLASLPFRERNNFIRLS